LFSRESKGQEFGQSNFFVGSVSFCQIKDEIRSKFHEELPAGTTGSNEVILNQTGDGNALPVIFVSGWHGFRGCDSLSTDTKCVSGILNVASCVFVCCCRCVTGIRKSKREEKSKISWGEKAEQNDWADTTQIKQIWLFS
jgi:hypothetical protein